MGGQIGYIAMKLRSVGAIAKLMVEMQDRIWYDRSQVGEKIRKEKGEKLSPDIQKGMTAARKHIEKMYGGKKALNSYYKSDFDWGMMNGKLSALRWVLGDEMDNLDT
jgi:hypothetical protein